YLGKDVMFATSVSFRRIVALVAPLREKKPMVPGNAGNIYCGIYTAYPLGGAQKSETPSAFVHLFIGAVVVFFPFHASGTNALLDHWVATSRPFQSPALFNTKSKPLCVSVPVLCIMYKSWAQYKMFVMPPAYFSCTPTWASIP